MTATLITNAHLEALCDRLAACYTQSFTVLGDGNNAPVAGTVQGTVSNLQSDILGWNEVTQVNAFLNPAANLLSQASFQAMAGWLYNFLQPNTSGPLYNHIAKVGPNVNAAIVSLSTYLTYYNATPFTCLLTPDFASLLTAIGLGTLPAAGVMSPAIQPDYTSSASSHGMGDYDIASTTYTRGDQVGVTSYLLSTSPVNPVIEVVTAFSGGSSAPAVNISGTDDQGNACTLNSAVTLTGNNPAGPLSGITVTPAITAGSRQTVALSSVTGIVAGSVLTINKGLPDQEVIVVEQVISSTIVAVFRKAHASSATVDGWNSYAAGNLSTGAGRRLAKLAASSGITLTLHSHTAGKVRIAGAQDRVSV